jgi:hypothetical protein
MPKKNNKALVPVEVIGSRVYLVRGQKIRLDSDLAELYQVATKSLNLAVRRNADRFPEDFMFQLTKQEAGSLRFQFETSNGRGGRRYLPNVFTEQGVAMLSSVLKSKHAIQVNILIMRAFVRLREVLSTHKDVVRKLEQLERVQDEHGAHIGAIWRTVRNYMRPAKRNGKYRIGFNPDAK